MAEFFKRPHILKILIVINFLGTLWGFWWYHLQLLNTPVVWWPLVPDSPFASASFTVLLILLLYNKQIPWFHLFASFISIKYGIWAVLVIGDYWRHGGPVRLMEIMLLLSHLGMAAEAIIYLPFSVYGKFSYMPFVLFTLLNDFADYVFDKHPYFFYNGQETFGMMSALTLSAVLACAAYLCVFYGKNKARTVRKGLL